MTLWTIACCLVGWGATDHVDMLDSFDYPTTAAASQVWHAQAERGEAIRVGMAQIEGQDVLELPTPFATHPKLGRVYIDRQVNLDLAAAGELRLEVRSTAPESGCRLSLYFHSEQGWYAAGADLSGRNWQTLRFSKAAFTVEESPTGWHKIDAIRIAVWRGQPQDGTVYLQRLEAAQHDVALIIPSASASGELRSALQTAEDVGEMLSELGLGSDAVEDTAVVRGALGKRRIAILAYNPGLSSESTEALVQFVNQGGKVVACYQLPRELGEALGFAQPRYVRPARPGGFAEIRFEAPDVEGLPQAVRQASWNITTAEPAGFHARVIAKWFDDAGQPTEQPAMLLSDRGAFFSHIILRDDRAQKVQMLAAILGQLAPPLWRQMADQAMERSGQVGHLPDRKALVEFLEDTNNLSPSGKVDAAHHLATGQRLCKAAERKHAEGQYAEAVKLAAEAHREWKQGYLAAQPSKSVEGRAFWNHSGTGAYPGDWDRTARELSKAGFNMILPNMLWGGTAHYASDVLPRSRTFEQYGDQIEQCVAAAQKHGLQVHVWKVNWNLSGAPQEFVAKIHQENRNQVSVDGKAHDWLCPSHPDNFQLELDSMLEVARKHDVDGLHFDYIRYPDRDKCYCEGCRARFEADLARKVANWPQDCYSGPLRDDYATWRCKQITRLVKAVHDEAKQLRGDITISAAVFGDYPSCRESVAQDWPVWIADELLDFVCPMDYSQDDQAFMALVSNQLRLVDGRIPLYPGIGQWRLTEDRTVGQIFLARQLGVPGFTIFDLSAESIHSAVPAVGLGVGRQKATPPHSTDRR